MNHVLKQSKILLAIVMCCCQTYSFGHDLVYRLPTGEISTIEIENECPFTEAISRVRLNIEAETSLSYLNDDYVLDFMSNTTPADAKNVQATLSMRSYNLSLEQDEKKTINFVVKTLGNASLLNIAKEKSSLEKAGKTIEHIHPLDFLHYVFSDEPLIAAAHNIQNRGWIWHKFFKGLKNSLDEEMTSNNVLPHIKSFSSKLNIDSKSLHIAAKKGNWKEFLNILYKEIPRSETSSRYDM